MTGAAGLLGSWVSAALSDVGAEVIGLDNAWDESWDPEPPRIAARRGDVRDLRVVSSVLGGRGVDAVVHLAAQPLVVDANLDPLPTFANNIEGTWTVLEGCRRAPSTPVVVVASSDKAYGEGGGGAYDESMALAARHPYAASKACADILAQTYAESYGLPVVITRCGNLYGGGDRNWSRIVPGTVRSVIAGVRPVIRSDGSPVRDYLYVEDVAAGVLALTKAIALNPTLKGEAFNFGGGERCSVIDLVTRILNLMGSHLQPDIRNEATNEISEQRVGAAKVRDALGWAACTSLDEGLRKTVAWYETHLVRRP